ncbi:hypothetical protein IQ06DRAFT_105268 [Phaeosphaeriaceae sp. SRC1lsM3a]|nr:hypothetical protein IQ06DRAFT_105268 [Stagonospora sp. SRC1lsM3a]
MSSASDMPPGPPLYLFRIVKTIATTEETRTTLCLPRELELPSNSDESALLASIQDTESSSLLPVYAAFLPQLVLVHTATSPSTLRHISDNIRTPRHRAVQLTSDAETSWACEVPIFGPTLREFCVAYKTAYPGTAGVPSWFLAHIFVELIEAVCEADIKSMLDIDAVRLNMHPIGNFVEDTYRFRNWPSLALDIACADHVMVDDDEVARCVLEMVRDVMLAWSDSAPFVTTAGLIMETTDPLLLVLGQMIKMSTSERDVSLQDLRSRFVGHLSDIRITGPIELPSSIKEYVYADLVTNEDMKKATSKPVVIKFERKYEAFLKLTAGEELEIGSGGFAGMRTGRIMVVRFGRLRTTFLVRVGAIPPPPMPTATPQQRR